jgi:hypothetical protein
MQLHKQLFRHAPEKGTYGDCYRTCIACLLGLTPAEVPHFFDGPLEGDVFRIRSAYTEMTRWLADRGFVRIAICHRDRPLNQVLGIQASSNHGVPFILCGTSTSGLNHAVIAVDGKIIHDPSLTDAGIVGPCDDGNYRVTYLGALIEAPK